MAVDSFARTLIFSMESKQPGVKEVEGISPISSSTGSSGIATVIHEDSGVTAGTYNSVTVNDTGHVTNGTNPTTLSGYGITDALNSTNPTGIGSLSMNRLDGSTVGRNSVTEGYNCTASGASSHAEGESTKASNTYAHAEGVSTTASGDLGAHAEGYGTIASGNSSHVEGKYNIADTGNYAHIIGNGTSDTARSNAFTVDWSGNVVASGDVTSSGGSLNLAYSTLSDLQAFVGYTDTDIYGVEVDFKNKEFTRLAGAVGKTPGESFDSVKAFGGRKRCNVTDAGKIIAYYGDAGFSETGVLTSAITIGETTYAVGTAVQVMVEQPLFYYKSVPIEFESIEGQRGYAVKKIRYYVSENPHVGFKPHPQFVRGGKTISKIYKSAYEGSAYDVSAAAYLMNDEQVVSFTASSGDKLSSIAGAKPMSGLTQNATRAAFRTIAKNRGNGWGQQDFASVCGTQLLFLIEYASFDSQSVIGRGRVDITDDGASNMSTVTGATASFGNGSGMAAGTNGQVSVTYRGEENQWGNIWKWEDSLNVHHIANDLGHALFALPDFRTVNPADNTDTGYTDVGFQIAGASGYANKIGWSEVCDFAFLAVATTGAANQPMNDYFYVNPLPNWYVSILGGGWYDGSNAGAFCRDVANASSHRHRALGGRALYVPAA